MPSTTLLTPLDAIAYLDSAIPMTELGRQEVLDLAEWVRDWDTANSKNIFCYRRDIGDPNVGYAIDVDNNRHKEKKPYFLVIKLANTDRYRLFKPLHVEFSFPKTMNNPHPGLLHQRIDNPVNWGVVATDIARLGASTLYGLVKSSYQNRT